MTTKLPKFGTYGEARRYIRAHLRPEQRREALAAARAALAEPEPKPTKPKAEKADQPDEG